MTIIRFIDSWLTRIIGGLLVIVFTVMLGLAVMQVILRAGFKTGLLWGDVAARHLVIWVGFFGAYLATKENKHFHIDILTRFLPPRGRSWFAAFSDMFAVVLCFFLMEAAYSFVVDGLGDEAVFLGIPQRDVALIVPIGFGLIMVQFILRGIESIVLALKGEAVPEAHV